MLSCRKKFLYSSDQPNNLTALRKRLKQQVASATKLKVEWFFKPNQVNLLTMHLANGLEFRAVVVIACDDEILPLQERISTVANDSDLKEVYNTERHLLYVACTRARDQLFVTGVEPASEFLDDLTQDTSAIA